MRGMIRLWTHELLHAGHLQDKSSVVCVNSGVWTGIRIVKEAAIYSISENESRLYKHKLYEINRATWHTRLFPFKVGRYPLIKVNRISLFFFYMQFKSYRIGKWKEKWGVPSYFFKYRIWKNLSIFIFHKKIFKKVWKLFFILTIMHRNKTSRVKCLYLPLYCKNDFTFICNGILGKNMINIYFVALLARNSIQN